MSAWKTENNGQLGGSVNSLGLNNKAFAARYTLRYFDQVWSIADLSRAEMRITMHAADDGTFLGTRVIDAVTSKEFEFKNWTSGAINWATKRERKEFVLDAIRHAPDFTNLKWIVNINAQPKAAELKLKMLEALDDPRIAKQIELLKRQGDLPRTYSVEKLKSDFSSDVFDRLVEFVADA